MNLENSKNLILHSDCYNQPTLIHDQSPTCQLYNVVCAITSKQTSSTWEPTLPPTQVIKFSSSELNSVFAQADFVYLRVVLWDSAQPKHLQVCKRSFRVLILVRRPTALIRLDMCIRLGRTCRWFLTNFLANWDRQSSRLIIRFPRGITKINMAPQWSLKVTQFQWWQSASAMARTGSKNYSRSDYKMLRCFLGAVKSLQSDSIKYSLQSVSQLVISSLGIVLCSVIILSEKNLW